MLDPPDLLNVARALATTSTTPSDAELRRAISTAYYALFHTALRMAAERFVGHANSGTAGYALLYRGFAHGRMKDVCNAIDKAVLTPRYRNLLRCPQVSQDLRDFANLFVSLQQRRHTADYDPQAVILQADAVDACDGAELAMQALGRVGGTELTDLFALLLVDARG